MTPSVTDKQVSVALRAFLLGILPAGVECVQGQANRVPEVSSPDFVIFTIMSDRRLSTTVDAYDPVADTASHLEAVQTAYQLDIHGPNSTDNARAIKLIWRSLYACDAIGDTFQPLYASDGSQRPFVNGEGQFEDRWVLTLEMQVNPSVVTPQQFADSVVLPLLPVAGA